MIPSSVKSADRICSAGTPHHEMRTGHPAAAVLLLRGFHCAVAASARRMLKFFNTLAYTLIPEPGKIQP
jgi:hypothetical protein